MTDNPLIPLTIVIIRHGEKPETGDNLSPEGQSRALRLPAILVDKFGIPNHIYVPALGTDITTTHARMFQTVTPLAVQYNLGINTKFDERDFAGITSHLREKTGMALVVWEHHAINDIALGLGIQNAPVWADDDYDSIWIITYKPSGTPLLILDKQGITPARTPGLF